MAVKLDCQLLWLLEENSEEKDSDWLLLEPLEDAEVEPKTESVEVSDEELPNSASAAPPPPPPW